MNEHLVERFGRRTVGKSERYDTPSPAPRTIGPNHLLRNYWRKEISDSSSWRSQPELPAASEIFTPKTGDGSGTGGGNSAADGDDSEEVDDDDVVGIPINKIDEPWVDKEDYLSSHYGLLREDVVAPLRDAVKEVQENPGMGENKSICIYENVHITGFTFCRQGPAARVCFSIARAGKRIRWEQSTRLRAGSVVALSPSHDNFRQHCTVAVIAARPLEGLQQNPPTVDLLFATTEEIEIDPLEKWIMVEARSVFFEANRHTLLALQRMMSETFPLANHLVDLEGDVSPPGYIQRNPFIDLRSISSEENPEAENVNVLEAFPHGLETTLDSSQLAALRRILSKRLAIVQGPPGTGKTHVSVLAVKALMEKVAETDSPLIVTAQTNHALDQLLRLIAEFEPNFIRLGSRSLDMDIIKPRTLYEVRKGRKDKNTMPKINCNLRSSAFKRIKKIEKEMKTIITPLLQEGAPCPAQVLFELGLLTESQYNSLENDTQAWVQPIREDNSFGSIATWLGGQLLPVGATTEVDTFDFEDEELDLEFEQLKELEAELSGAINDDEGGDRLQGIWLPIKEPFTSRCSPGFSEKLVSQALRVDDLYQIPPDHRGTVYCQLRKRAKKMILTNFRRKTKEYLSAAHDIRMGDLEESSALLRESRIIGMTTTGLSKNRALIASIEPKIVMVEEASETLEGHVSAACFESLEHLILVGDHKQLRGHCSTAELEGPPFNLAVSVFERLIQNGVESTCLAKQRRMIPELRRLLNPIYPHLEDHESVHCKEAVPGMGGVNSLFFSHTYPESTDSLSSKCNSGEADMIVGLFNYLLYNGLTADKITVLTFYNGQRKLLLAKLKALPNVQGRFLNVKTVDSYQGEENGVVILSLARSNKQGDIGFLATENRICVAISRAQRGFYVFGNLTTVYRASSLWQKVFETNKDRVKFRFPVTCSGHKTTTWIKGPEDWKDINGGCRDPCGGTLPCGHACAFKCHPFEHQNLLCDRPCRRVLPCGHPCLEKCHVKTCRCVCSRPSMGPGPPMPPTLPQARQTPPKSKQIDTWQAFASREAFATDVTSAMRLQQREAEDSGRSFAFDSDSPPNSGATSPPSVDGGERRVIPVDSATLYDGEGGMRYRHKELFSLSRPEERSVDASSFVNEPSLLD